MTIIPVLPVPPVMYGPVMNIRGPTVPPRWIALERLSSSYGARLPVVRVVVTPEARYNRGAAKGEDAARAVLRMAELRRGLAS